MGQIRTFEGKISQRSHDNNHGITTNTYHRRCGASSIMFPYHCYKLRNTDRRHIHIVQFIADETRRFTNFHLFPKVYATDGRVEDLNRAPVATYISSSEGEEQSQNVKPSLPYEALARAYIAKESGMERVRMLFKKDHKGESSTQMVTLKIALAQTFLVSFLIKYVLTWKFEREEFIREHNATAFRTHIAASRQMRDHLSLKSATEGVLFATKISLFSAGFIFLSQSIASYRNKTSVIEYTVGAGVVGGLARINMGLRGFISGSVVGSVLGTVIGALAYVGLNVMGMSQECQHLREIMSRLEVEKSIVGDSVFKQRVMELTSSIEPAQKA